MTQKVQSIIQKTSDTVALQPETGQRRITTFKEEPEQSAGYATPGHALKEARAIVAQITPKALRMRMEQQLKGKN